MYICMYACMYVCMYVCMYDLLIVVVTLCSFSNKHVMLAFTVVTAICYLKKLFFYFFVAFILQINDNVVSQ